MKYLTSSSLKRTGRPVLSLPRANNIQGIKQDQQDGNPSAKQISNCSVESDVEGDYRHCPVDHGLGRLLYRYLYGGLTFANDHPVVWSPSGRNAGGHGRVRLFVYGSSLPSVWC